MRWRDEIERKGVKMAAAGAAVIVTLVNDLYKTIMLHSALLPKNGDRKHHKKINKEINKLYRHKEYFSDEELKEFAELVMIKAQMDVERLLESRFFHQARELVKKVVNLAVRLDFHRFMDWGKEKFTEIDFSEEYHLKNSENSDKLV